MCASLEAELAELEGDDRQEMLEGLGLTEPAIGRLARAAHSILGLSVFYTAGPKEVRAWPVVANSSAREAAGTIHSDMQRGFIRAECGCRHESSPGPATMPAQNGHRKEAGSTSLVKKPEAA